MKSGNLPLFTGKHEYIPSKWWQRLRHNKKKDDDYGRDDHDDYYNDKDYDDYYHDDDDDDDDSDRDGDGDDND